ncbi:MAG: AMP-binding protein, partial [Cyanobacteria bacterium J06627_28]
MKHFIDPQQVNSPVGVNPTSRLSALERSDPTKLVADTLLERLNFHVVHRPKQVAYRFLADQSAPVSQSATTIWTYQKLHRHALQVAHSLLTQFEKGVGEGVAQQRVLLVYPPGLELIAAFLGCLSVGTIAIPVPPPRRHESLSRWQHILTDAQATGILTSQALASELASEIEPLIRLSSGLGKPPSLRWLVVEAPADEEAKTTDKESLFASLASRIEQQSPPREAIAFLQYTSGSTSQPKGAMVTHGNLAHNLQQIQQFFGHDEQTQGVIWLPPYHDMGLIGGILQPLYGGYPVTLMSPSSFLRRPARWLEAISHFGATTSGGPNFAYDYCVKKIAPNDCRSLDLSSWQVAFTGAEPIQAQTLRQFSARFQDSGFNTSAFYPCYGLAESTLLVSGGSPTVSPNVITLDQEGLLRHRVQLVESVEQKAQYQMNGVEAKRKTTVEVVSCGKVVNQLIRIVNPSTGVACEADEIGEIWLSGESVAAGYWGRVEATHQCFRASLASEPDIAFLRTGDLGFVHQGELFITGRLKDLIVIRGQNYYPQDIEVSLAEAHAALLPASAAFSINNKGEESLAIAQEISRTAVRSLRKGDLKATEIIATIRSTISHEYGLHASAVVLLKPGQLPRTTSGKIQRHRCKQCFETGEWDVIEQSPVPPVKDFKEQQSSTSSQEKQEKKAIEEQTTQSLVNWLRKYAREHIDSRQMDERRCLSPGLVLDLGNQGLLGMQVPAAYGGLGLGHQSMLTILQQLGAIDLTLALFVGLNNVLGIRPILRYGSNEL